jgi:hypothetical protein
MQLWLANPSILFFVSLAIVNQVLKTTTSQDFHLKHNNNQSPQELQRYVLYIL